MEIWFPIASHGWFLLWLLLFFWIYTTIESATQTDNGAQPIISTLSRSKTSTTTSTAGEILPFPSTKQRMIYGVTVCGVLMYFTALFVFPTSLLFMPMTIGSLICDIFMFVMGILARKNDWLSQLQTQTSFRHLSMAVGLEMMAIITIQNLWLDVKNTNSFSFFIYYVICGIYCLDMSQLILASAQQLIMMNQLQIQNYEDKKNDNTQQSKSLIITMFKYLTRAAYTVYLIHPLVICAVTAIYIHLYNSNYYLVSNNQEKMITFEIPQDQQFVFFAPSGQGGGADIFTGWIFVNIFSHLLVWPISYLLTQMPILKYIL